MYSFYLKDTVIEFKEDVLYLYHCPLKQLYFNLSIWRGECILSNRNVWVSSLSEGAWCHFSGSRCQRSGAIYSGNAQAVKRDTKLFFAFGNAGATHFGTAGLYRGVSGVDAVSRQTTHDLINQAGRLSPPRPEGFFTGFVCLFAYLLTYLSTYLLT